LPFRWGSHIPKGYVGAIAELSCWRILCFYPNKALGYFKGFRQWR